MGLIRDLRRVMPPPSVQVETAEVTDISGTTAKVKRAGQTSSTKYLPIASGVTVNVGDIVQLQRYNGNINTAVIVQKIR